MLTIIITGITDVHGFEGHFPPLDHLARPELKLVRITNREEHDKWGMGGVWFAVDTNNGPILQEQKRKKRKKRKKDEEDEEEEKKKKKKKKKNGSGSPAIAK